jgi:SAM-dependent methyltransferase
MTNIAAEYWENRYRTNGRSWSGAVNVSLEGELAGVEPGTALDLGCGEGGDALWLAHQGWSVTAVDISPTALEIGEAEQKPDDDITWIAADLASWQPPARYDLVTSSFLHSTVELPREQILRRGAEAVVPGGLFVTIGHFDQAGPHHEHIDLPTPDELFARVFDGSTSLDAAEWTLQTSRLIERTGTGPDGKPMRLLDSVLKVKRN